MIPRGRLALGLEQNLANSNSLVPATGLEIGLSFHDPPPFENDWLGRLLHLVTG